MHRSGCLCPCTNGTRGWAQGCMQAQARGLLYQEPAPEAAACIPALVVRILSPSLVCSLFLLPPARRASPAARRSWC